MSNPNNCAECDHHKMQRVIEKNDSQATPLHCYMFKDEPTEVCMQHTARKVSMPTREQLIEAQMRYHAAVRHGRQFGYY